MLKYRVICPNCEASLLVTEDLLGQEGSCPGCQAEFLLPTAESFTEGPVETPSVSEMRPAENFTEAAQPETSEFPRRNPLVPPLQRPRPAARKEIKIERRGTLRMLAGMMRGMAALQAVAGCSILIILLLNAIKAPVPVDMVLITVGIAVLVGTSSIPTLAFSELVLVFISQDEMLRHLVNDSRNKG